VGKVTASQGGYYLEAVAHGREDYYTESGEVPGRWLGASSAALGLDGEVRDDGFIAVLAGVSPLDGERLCRSNRRVSGLDLTLSAPKSVSVLWALGSASTTTAVAAAHDAAIAATVPSSSERRSRPGPVATVSARWTVRG
jgi:conjugative relaxase-like TrwC/TraI family protein